MKLAEETCSVPIGSIPPPPPVDAPAPYVAPAQHRPMKPVSRGSKRAQRMHKQLQWRRARGAEYSFNIDVGTSKIEALQTPRGELMGLGTGAVVWDCAIVLTKYLEKNLQLFQPPPASILELGCGNGLLGMVCSLFFENAKVIVTEQEQLLPLIYQNIRHNKENNPRVNDVLVEEYNWGDRNEALEKVEYSWIVVSDCVFDKAPWDLLVRSLLLLCKTNCTKVLVAIEHRNHKNEQLFWQQVKQEKFEVNKISHDQFDEDFSADDIDLYFLTLTA